ncbi:hypothetical protein O3G_MSEX013023 [Manduca sexta]|uniref:Uncharacterized protein n=1 Tax=Manduca sexta TaxID=7130 RepID=A0A921ZQ20_MANSE|nr:hypothetical protein O3G_MSEX013023 [Manduca sexta]
MTVASVVAAPGGGIEQRAVISCEFFFRKTRLHAQYVFISFPSGAGHIDRSRRALSGQSSAASVTVRRECACAVPSCLSIVHGAALPYIPEAVPRLVFVDRRRDGRVSASAAPGVVLRSGDGAWRARDRPSFRQNRLAVRGGRL